MEGIINKVAESGIVTLDLKDYLPAAGSIKAFDLKPFLFREMILKEKDFRTALTTIDWSAYEGMHVALFCSADAIIPMWAYMLAASYLQPVAASVYYGNEQELERYQIAQCISRIDTDEYKEKRLVLKGCGDVAIPEAAYVAATTLLRPVVKSLMYGEPCSTVPVYKRK